MLNTQELEQLFFRVTNISGQDTLRELEVEIQKTLNIFKKMQEIIDFIKPHITSVGLKQAAKDFRRGLYLLNKGRKKSPSFLNACKNYSPRIIKKYIKKGIQNNIIFGTKNDKRVNTKQLMDAICKNLERSA